MCLYGLNVLRVEHNRQILKDYLISKVSWGGGQEKERKKDKKGGMRESWLQIDMEGTTDHQRRLGCRKIYFHTHIYTHTWWGL